MNSNSLSQGRPAVAALSYVALPTALVQQVRATMRDETGNALSAWVSDEDGNPCRHCLRLTKAGERLILFTHRPFETPGPYAESGPVFVHADPCERYDPQGGIPRDFLDRSLTLRSYGSTDRGALSIVDAVVAAPGDAEGALGHLFADERVQFVHVRNPAWGCYDFRVERSPAR
jgi:hypothetical protein